MALFGASCRRWVCCQIMWIHRFPVEWRALSGLLCLSSRPGPLFIQPHLTGLDYNLLCRVLWTNFNDQYFVSIDLMIHRFNSPTTMYWKQCCMFYFGKVPEFLQHFLCEPQFPKRLSNRCDFPLYVTDLNQPRQTRQVLFKASRIPTENLCFHFPNTHRTTGSRCQSHGHTEGRPDQHLRRLHSEGLTSGRDQINGGQADQVRR